MANKTTKKSNKTQIDITELQLMVHDNIEISSTNNEIIFSLKSIIDQSTLLNISFKLDKEGKFDFDPPYQGDMTILLKVDQAHDTDFELTEQDFLDAAAETE